MRRRDAGYHIGDAGTRGDDERRHAPCRAVKAHRFERGTGLMTRFDEAGVPMKEYPVEYGYDRAAGYPKKGVNARIDELLDYQLRDSARSLEVAPRPKVIPYCLNVALHAAQPSAAI